MPAIHSKSRCEMVINESEVPYYRAIETLDLHCRQCGNRWNMMLPMEYQSDKEIAAYWQERFMSAMDRINKMIVHMQSNYGRSPEREILVNMATKLRDELFDERESDDE